MLRLLSEKYDEALKKYDVLVIPTINCLPPKLPSEDLNTAGMVFNITQDTKNIPQIPSMQIVFTQFNFKFYSQRLTC